MTQYLLSLKDYIPFALVLSFIIELASTILLLKFAHCVVNILQVDLLLQQNI